VCAPGVLEGVAPTDPDLEPSVGDPLEDVVGAGEQFLARSGVVPDARPRDVERAARLQPHGIERRHLAAGRAVEDEVAATTE
jgi:hypothetical protein